MAEIKAGDVVRFRSGFHEMMVEGYEEPERVTCVWHDDVGVPYRETYHVKVLIVKDVLSGDFLGHDGLRTNARGEVLPGEDKLDKGKEQGTLL